MTAAARWFQPTRPAPDLRHLLVCSYTAVSGGRHDLLPDGCMDLVWSEQTGIILCGPDSRGWSFDMPAAHPIAGVRFRAGAAAGTFRVIAAELVDQRVALGALVGDRLARPLTHQLVEAGDGAARVAALAGLVRRLATDVDPTVAVAARVTAQPAVDVDALADQAGVSTRQLRRRFDRAVGYGPAFLARIARLQRFATRALRDPGHGIAELAAVAGYVDQSHLAKDVRAFTDRTPVELVAGLDRSSLVGDVAAGGRSVQDGPPGAGGRSAA